MNTNIRKWTFLVIFLTTLLFFSSCSTSGRKNISVGQVEQNYCEISGIEVPVATEWSVRGATSKIFAPVDEKNIFEIIGSATDFEEDIKINLEFFFSEEFYRNEVSFDYSEDRGINRNGSVGRHVKGTIYNARNGQTLYFNGYFINTPTYYIFYVCREGNSVDQIEDMCNASFEGVITAK